MRAFYEDIKTRKGNQSFIAYNLQVAAFPFKWHYHPEYELTLITKGSGRRLVGDSHENFEAGDLVLIGPGMPHTWVSHRVGKANATAVVILFSKEFIGSFLQLTEFAAVARLLSQAANGLFFPARNCKKVVEDIKMLPGKTGVEKITSLLLVLQQLSSKKAVNLASSYFNPVRGVENEKRINKVCQYIQKNAGEKISLEETAAMVHLSATAFCKLFKRATGKTFSDYVNDIRIGHACTLLTESEKSVNEIAYACGYESLTYFNRVFLKKKQTTPRGFRQAALHYES